MIIPRQSIIHCHPQKFCVGAHMKENSFTKVIFFSFLHNKDWHNEMRQVLKDADNSKVSFLYLQHQNQWEICFIHQKEGQKMAHWVVRILHRTLTVKR